MTDRPNESRQGSNGQLTVGNQKAMHIERRFTTAGQDAYTGIEFKSATSEIRNPDGSVVFRLEDIAVPASWSQVAADIIAQKYFRKAGVAKVLKKVEENDEPKLRICEGYSPGSVRSA